MLKSIQSIRLDESRLYRPETWSFWGGSTLLVIIYGDHCEIV